MHLLVGLTTGQWWRFDNAPSPAEWQALAAFATLVVAVIAAGVAIRQLKAMRKSSEAANTANELAAKASTATMRPYMVVRFQFKPSVPRNPRSTASGGLVLVVIENIGRTAAENVTLTSNPEFQDSGDGAPESPSRTIDWLRSKFSGAYSFKYFPPGHQISYILDTAEGMMDPARGLPQQYSIRARYQPQVDSDQTFDETMVLDAEPWRLSPIESDPLEVIAQQARRFNQNAESKSAR